MRQVIRTAQPGTIPSSDSIRDRASRCIKCPPLEKRFPYSIKNLRKSMKSKPGKPLKPQNPSFPVGQQKDLCWKHRKIN